MDIVSIVFLIIIAVFIIVGLIKGFARSIIDFVGEILVLVGAAFLTKPASSFINNIEFVLERKNDVYNYLINFNPLFGEVFSKDNKEGIKTALSQLNIPEILNSFLTDQIIPYMPDDGIVLADVLSSTLISVLVTVISFVALYIVLRIIFMVIKVLSKKIIDSIKPIKNMDRVLGGILGLIVGVIAVNILCLLITVKLSIPMLEGFNLFLIDQMQLNTDNFTLSKFIYENNLILLIITWIL